MQKVIYRADVNDYMEQLEEPVIMHIEEGTIQTFEAFDNFDIIAFDWFDIDQIAKLTVKVYTSAKTNCADEEIMVQYKTLPMYNYYSDSQYCEENPKEEVCQQYVTNEITEEEYYKQVDKHVSSGEEEKEEKNVVKKVTNYFKKNKKQVIIGGSIIIVVGVVTTAVVIIKRRRSRLI